MNIHILLDATHTPDEIKTNKKLYKFLFFPIIYNNNTR